MTIETINFIARWGHVLFGITWIGMLYYFNFVQGGYFKQATPEGLADAKQKLAPSALWWFRWGAMFTFLTGLVLIGGVQHYGQMKNYIIIGSTMGIIMAANVWMVIWPAQKIALGMIEGDAPAAGAKALLASRTNTLLSAPMLFAMLAGPHYVGHGYGTAVGGTGLIAALLVIGVLEANALKGRLGPIASVRGVIVSSLILTAVFALMINML